MDDGSRDDSQAILEDYKRKDSRFRLFYHDDAQGLTASLIELSRLATGRYFMRQDADDWSESKRLERQLAILSARTDMAVVGSWFAVYTNEGNYLDTVQPFAASTLLKRALRHKNPLAHGSLLLRREAFEAVGGYRAAFRMAQDYDLLLRLAERYELECVSDSLYHVHLSAQGVGRSQVAQQSAYARLALVCARERRSGRSDKDLLAGFHPETPTGAEDVRPYQMAFHLTRSRQREKARAALRSWHPVTPRLRVRKWLLQGLNSAPTAVARLVLQAAKWTSVL